MTTPENTQSETPKVVDLKLDLADGKYTYIRYQQGGQEALRYGEKWRDLTGDNLIYFMGVLIEEAKRQLDKISKSACLLADYENLERQLSTCRAELERAKEDRNRAAMQERQKYTLKLKDCRAETMKEAIEIINNLAVEAYSVHAQDALDRAEQAILAAI